MRVITIVFIVFALTACSSKPFISTDEYRDQLKERCVSELPDEQKQDQGANNRCSYNAMMSMVLAKRLYENSADTDYAKCKELYTERELINECFKARQVEYYDNWMTMPLIDIAK